MKALLDVKPNKFNGIPNSRDHTSKRKGTCEVYQLETSPLSLRKQQPTGHKQSVPNSYDMSFFVDIPTRGFISPFHVVPYRAMPRSVCDRTPAGVNNTKESDLIRPSRHSIASNENNWELPLNHPAQKVAARCSSMREKTETIKIVSGHMPTSVKLAVQDDGTTSTNKILEQLSTTASEYSDPDKHASKTRSNEKALNETANLFREFLTHSLISTRPPNAIPTANPMLQSFHLFPNLPPELRLAIWKLSRPPPQIIQLSRRHSAEGVYTKNPPPGQVHANHESRTVTLTSWYTLNSSSQIWVLDKYLTITPRYLRRDTIPFYFDPGHDYLYLGCERRDAMSNRSCARCQWMWPVRLQKVAEKIVIDTLYLDPMQMGYEFAKIAESFPALREIIFLSPETPSRLNRKRQRRARQPIQLADLVPSSHQFQWQCGKSLIDTFDRRLRPWFQQNGRRYCVEKVWCMELGDTHEAFQRYGFLKAKFLAMDVRSILQKPILGVTIPVGMSYSRFKHRKGRFGKRKCGLRGGTQHESHDESLET